MKNKRKQNYSFTVHSFMTAELGLGGGELLVYAFIYSFTKGEHGIFWGGLETVAASCGISLRTLYRALGSLKEEGLIERCVASGKEGYRCINFEEAERGELLFDGPPNDAEEDMPTAEFMREHGVLPVEALCEDIPRPKYSFHSVSRHEVIVMTAEQYKSLLRLVDVESLTTYINRLDYLIMNEGYRCRSPYKTIKKWIYRDAAL